MAGTWSIGRVAAVKGARRPALYWSAMLALPAVEVLALTLRFDSEHLVVRHGWLAVALQRPGQLISLGITVGAMLGLLLFGAARGGEERGGPAGTCARGRRAWPWLLGHLAMCGVLFRLTRSIVEGTAVADGGASGMAFGLWIGSGAGTMALWMLAALPPASWWRLVRARWGTLLAIATAGVAAMLLGRWTATLWGSFHGSTFWAVRGVLGLFYRDVVCRPDAFILGTPRFGVEISAQCSGFEGIGLIWVFLGVFCWWSRAEMRFPQAFLLFPMGTLLSWGANVLRIAGLIAVGDLGRPEVAVGGFHSQAGWLAFNGIGLGLVVLARSGRLFCRAGAREEHGHEPVTTMDPTAVYLGPMVAMALAMMITTAASGAGFDRFYAARVLAAGAVLWHFRREYAGLRWSGSWYAPAAGLAVFALWMAMEPAPQASTMNAIPDALARMPRAWAAAWLVARAIGSVIVVPVVEELAFRGYLTRRLIAADFRSVPDGRFTWPSFLISSLLFGLLHQRWIAGSLAGMVFALAYYRRGRLADAIAAHAITNLSITIYVLATGEWYRWS